MGEITKNIDGKIRFINTEPLKIIKDLTSSVEWLQNSYDNANETIKKMKEDTYKDDELVKLKEENTRLADEMRYGFPVSKEENDAIRKWMQDWFDRKRNGDTYMGAIAGGFVYQFHPTSIGVTAKVVAPDGEEFEFRNDL